MLFICTTSAALSHARLIHCTIYGYKQHVADSRATVQIGLMPALSHIRLTHFTIYGHMQPVPDSRATAPVANSGPYHEQLSYWQRHRNDRYTPVFLILRVVSCENSRKQ